jgi:trehalose 6-phosphate phosphatase
MKPANRGSEKTIAILDTFFLSLKKAPHSALVLDYDGTLAPFRVRPDKAVPYPGVRARLNGIIKAGHTRVVLISGRWTKDLIPLLGLKNLPEIWGSHGWERLQTDGTYQIFPFDERALRGLAEADMWVEEQGLEARCEQKPGCLALHWRGLDAESIARIRVKTSKKWSSLARRTGLQLIEFDGGIELRVPGRNKGHAVKTILKEMGGKAVVAYLGDDITDEDAFNTLKGKGLSILVRDQRRTTAADLRLKPPAELLDFLSRWHRARLRS